MTTDWVRLHLDLRTFDPTSSAGYLLRAQAAGITFTTFAELGDTPENRRRLYDLNKTCSADIPERDTFYTFDEYVSERIASPYFDPRGVVVAIDDGTWVALSMVSVHPASRTADGYAFAEMTGVVRSHRGRGLSMAVKLLATEFARSTGLRWLRTIHHPANDSAIAMNLRLGFAQGFPPAPVRHDRRSREEQPAPRRLNGQAQSSLG